MSERSEQAKRMDRVNERDASVWVECASERSERMKILIERYARVERACGGCELE